MAQPIITATRTIPADDFFTGAFATALRKAEIITAVSFPIPERAAYVKFANTASRYAIVGVFVGKSGSAVRVAVTGAKPAYSASRKWKRLWRNSFNADAIKQIAIDPRGLTADIHATAEYRAHLIGVMAQRAAAAAAAIRQ